MAMTDLSAPVKRDGWADRCGHRLLDGDCCFRRCDSPVPGISGDEGFWRAGARVALEAPYVTHTTSGNPIDSCSSSRLRAARRGRPRSTSAPGAGAREPARAANRLPVRSPRFGEATAWTFTVMLAAPAHGDRPQPHLPGSVANGVADRTHHPPRGPRGPDRPWK